MKFTFTFMSVTRRGRDVLGGIFAFLNAIRHNIPLVSEKKNIWCCPGIIIRISSRLRISFLTNEVRNFEAGCVLTPHFFRELFSFISTSIWDPYPRFSMVGCFAIVSTTDLCESSTAHLGEVYTLFAVSPF